MSDIRAALRLEHKPVEVDGVRFLLRRPTVADLAELLHVGETDKARTNDMLLCRHVLDEQGQPLFASFDEAAACPLRLAYRIVPLVEGLYAEGRD